MRNHTEVMRRFLSGNFRSKKKIWILLDRASRVDFVPLLEKAAPSKLAMVFIQTWIWKIAISIIDIVMCSSMPPFDYFITATDLQKEVLGRHLLDKDTKIPIYNVNGHFGNIDGTTRGQPPRFDVLTARLDPENASIGHSVVAQAHEQLPAFSLIFMGRVDLRQHTWFRLCSTRLYSPALGHADLKQICPRYQAYLTTSQWETFSFDFSGGGWSRFVCWALIAHYEIRLYKKRWKWNFWCLISWDSARRKRLVKKSWTSWSSSLKATSRIHQASCQTWPLLTSISRQKSGKEGLWWRWGNSAEKKYK